MRAERVANIRNAHASSGVFALSGKARNPCGWVTTEGTRIRHRGRNSALRACAPSRISASHGAAAWSAGALDLREGNGAPRRNRPCARGWPARQPARRRFHARQAAQTRSGRSESICRAASSGSRKPSIQPPQATSIAAPGRHDRRGGKRFPREAQKPRVRLR